MFPVRVKLGLMAFQSINNPISLKTHANSKLIKASEATNTKKERKKNLETANLGFSVSNKWMYVERNTLHRPSQKALKCEVIS